MIDKKKFPVRNSALDFIRDILRDSKVVVFLILGCVILTSFVFMVINFFVDNQKAIEDYFVSLDPNGVSIIPVLKVSMYVVGGLILLFFAVTLFKIFHHETRKREALKGEGIRQFVTVQKVEVVREVGEGEVVEYLNVFVTTPLEKKCVFEFPIDEDIEAGDKVMIVYHPSNPDFFQLVSENKKSVIQKVRKTVESK